MKKTFLSVFFASFFLFSLNPSYGFWCCKERPAVDGDDTSSPRRPLTAEPVEGYGAVSTVGAGFGSKVGGVDEAAVAASASAPAPAPRDVDVTVDQTFGSVWGANTTITIEERDADTSCLGFSIWFPFADFEFDAGMNTATHEGISMSVIEDTELVDTIEVRTLAQTKATYKKGRKDKFIDYCSHIRKALRKCLGDESVDYGNFYYSLSKTIGINFTESFDLVGKNIGENLCVMLRANVDGNKAILIRIPLKTSS